MSGFWATLWARASNAEHALERALGLQPPPDAPVDDAATSASSTSTSTAPAWSPGDDPVVGPAFPWLASWTATDRRALLDAQRAVGLDPHVGGLLAVIDHESGGDPRALNQLPAAGLIQLTVKAKLPGFDTPERVREVAAWSPARQFAEVVTPLYRRMGSKVQDGVGLLRRNFLPVLAAESDGYVLAVNAGATGPGGEAPADVLPGGHTRGAVYRSNYGFDPGAKLDKASGTISGGRGWFTWADADRSARASVARGASRGLMRVSGAVVPAAVATSGDPPMAGVAADAWAWLVDLEHEAERALGLRPPGDADPDAAPTSLPPGFAPALAPALVQLLRQVDVAYPARSRVSDGSLPSAAHHAANHASDHEWGGALDLTRDPLRGPDLQALADALRVDDRLGYVILDGRIANPAIQEGAWRTYQGADPHRSHLHVSVLRARAGDARPWAVPFGSLTGDPPMAGADAAAGLDPVTWVQIDAPGGYRVWTNAEPLARGGVPVVMSFAEELTAARALDALPITAAVEDARWAASQDSRVVPAVYSPDGAHRAGPTGDAVGREQTAKFAVSYGPLGTVLRTGGHKVMLAENDRRRHGASSAAELKRTGPGSMTFYGWRTATGGKVQQGLSSHHDRDWREYDSFVVLMRDDATRDGRPVSLRAELAGATPIGGPLPAWLLQELAPGGSSPAAPAAADPLAALSDLPERPRADGAPPPSGAGLGVA